jgi:hypothetical protein
MIFLLTPSHSDAEVNILESFEDSPANWQVPAETTGTGASVSRSTNFAAHGSSSARATTFAASTRAIIRSTFSDPATSHTWEERPGTFFWQNFSLYLPSVTLNKLGGNEYLTLAGLWPSAGGNFGWFLRVKEGGELFVYGYSADGKPVEFKAYGNLPVDKWVELELGLHTQGGPGVKRAFSFLVDGNFYGWYRQGHMKEEIYDRAGAGIVSTNSPDTLEVFVDQWQVAGNTSFPTGADNRPADNVQEQDFRTLNGTQVQYDWSTWEYTPTLHSRYGLYTPDNRLQAGRNIDKMPDLSSGWAEIEIDWPNGTPNTRPDSYFGPMVGFRKEINREQNMEVIPIGRGGGNVELVLEAWAGNPVILSGWQMPLASIGGGSRIPEPGDIIRVRWEQVDAASLKVQASYYDASAGQWHTDIISGTYNLSNVADNDPATNNVNFMDGFHTASSITIDSPSYSIRRYKVGNLTSFPDRCNPAIITTSSYFYICGTYQYARGSGGAGAGGVGGGSNAVLVTPLNLMQLFNMPESDNMQVQAITGTIIPMIVRLVKSPEVSLTSQPIRSGQITLK